MEDNWKMVLSSEDAKVIGKDLMATAAEERKKQFGKLVIRQIQELMSQRAQTLNYIEKAHSEIEMYEKRLEAINNGEFTVGFDGVISYNDKTLQLR